ncbi:MAG: DUF624 domain-containing protein [Bacilli bacterium]|jgi:uncharacterized membrane protein YesL|nr:DUF624 domain-containing protein [Bacilli bacterium]HHU23721.1 DUF624 domain-containing protein [Acholeplasmataceae bacterium]
MNFEKYINSRVFSFFNFLYKLVVISLLCFIASTLNLYVFGILASGVAAIILFKTSSNDSEIPLVLTFWLGFKRNYFKALKISLIMFVMVFILAFNTYYFYRLTLETKTMYSYIALYITIGLDIITFTTLILIMLVCVYFPFLNVYHTIKYSVTMLFVFPGAFFMLVGLVIVFLILSYLFWYLIPLLIPGLFLYLVQLLYRNKLNKLLTEDGIKPLDAPILLNEFRSKRAKKKNEQNVEIDK